MHILQLPQVIASSGWLIAIGAMLAGCQPADTSNAAGDNLVEDSVVNLPAAVAPVAPMEREAILLAVAKAASARAAGVDDAALQRQLEGRPFEFSIRFGCSGAAKELRSAALGWSYQPDQETLRLRATPTITADDPLAAMIGGEAVEAIEGFWVPLPWLLEAGCPAVVTESAEPAEPDALGDQAAKGEVGTGVRPPKVGIAQFFTRSDARTRRRDRRAYEAVIAVEPGSPVGSKGFDLVLSGRLRPLPGKRVIECIAATIDLPPDCIVTADIDEVRMERPEDGNVLARWSS